MITAFWKIIAGVLYIGFKLVKKIILVFIAGVIELIKYVKNPEFVKKRKISKNMTNNIKEELYKIDRLNGIDFEYYVANLLEKSGYHEIKINKASGDYGVDITAIRDQTKYAIQCKRYSSKVSLGAIQEVAAGLSLYKCDIGIVVTNNYFTKNAINLANANGIILWDREELARLINIYSYK